MENRGHISGNKIRNKGTSRIFLFHFWGRYEWEHAEQDEACSEKLFLAERLENQRMQEIWNKGTRKLYWDMDNKKNSGRCTCYIRV